MTDATRWFKEKTEKRKKIFAARQAATWYPVAHHMTLVILSGSEGSGHRTLLLTRCRPAFLSPDASLRSA